MDKREIRFDGWKVDFDSGEITRDGATHRLQDQPLQILEELSSRPGEVVTREALISRLWPTGVVEFDTGLNTAMRKLRIALGDDADTPRYIETLPRKGYRFIAKLDPPPTPVRIPGLPREYVPTPFEKGPMIGRRASDRRAPFKRLAWGFGSLATALILAIVAWHLPGKMLFGVSTEPDPLPTIVVLPLVDMSLDQHEAALCDGLTEELSNWLAHIPTLRVVARTSAFAFKGKNMDVREIARRLGASHVLEGSLRRSGNQLRITVQLIAAESGLHMWSRSYDLPFGDIFAIEDAVSRNVAEALHLELSNDTTEQWAQRRSDTTDGLELYLLARERQRRRTAEDNQKAIEYFRRAVAADPQFTPALTGLAESLMNGLSLNHTPLEDVKAEVEPLLNRALRQAPNSPEVLAVQGWLLTEDFRFDEALAPLERAVRLNPNDSSSHRFLGNLYDRRGEPAQALRHFTLSASLDPMDFLPHVFRCMELIDLGEYADADDACARARELDAENYWGPLVTGWIARAQGKTQEALNWTQTAHKLAPADGGIADEEIDLLLTLGRFDEARAVARDSMPAGDFFMLARQAQVELAADGPEALKRWLADHDMTRKAGTSAELAELARLQLLANDPAAARVTLDHAERILPSSPYELYDGGQIRHEYSAALFHACIELRGGGDRAKAMKLLKDLDGMLDRYAENGGEHFGLFAMRAESYAMQGRMKEAQDAIDEAWKRGWRGTWRVHREPYLTGLAIPGERKRL